MNPDPTSHRLKVLCIAIANGFSSEVRVMSTLVRDLDQLDAVIMVHNGAGSDGAPDQVSATSGRRVIAHDFGWQPVSEGSKLRRLLRVVSSARRLLPAIRTAALTARAERPDIVYSSQQKWDSLVAMLVARFIKRPHVIHLHYIPGPWLGALTMRELSRRPIICVSGFISRRVTSIGADPRSVYTVLNPIDPVVRNDAGSRRSIRQELGADDSTVIVGNVSRLTPWKGQIETIQAAAILGERGLDFRLVIVGDGDPEFTGRLGDLAADLNIADRIVFTGRRKDVKDLLSAFDVFVHPSYEDPCPLAVLEAQASALPVVAFDEGGIPEIVANGVTGLLCPGRDVRALAQCLEELIKDEALRDKMGVAAAERMSTQFTRARSSSEFLKALTAIADAGR